MAARSSDKHYGPPDFSKGDNYAWVIVAFSVANDVPQVLWNCFSNQTMRKVHRVIVCGNTVALAGIETSLGLDAGCEVIGHGMPINLQELRELQPDVMVFALDDVPYEFIRALSNDLPNLLLIGIDLECNRAQIWSGQQAAGWTSRDLAQVIHQMALRRVYTRKKEK